METRRFKKLAPTALIGAVGLALTMISTPAKAQDQVEIIDDATRVLKWDSTPEINPHSLTYAQAKHLIQSTLQARDTPPLPYVDDPDFYCLIQLVIWKQPDKDTKKPEIEYKRWYVFRGGTKWDQVKLESTRVYGGHRVAILGVHWSPSVQIPSDVDLRSAVKQANDTATDDDIRNTVQSLQDELINGPIHRFSDDKGNLLVLSNGVPFVKGYPPNVSLTYRVEVTSKLPAPWAHLLQLATAVSQAGGMIPLKSILRPIWTGRLLNIQYVPSDIVVRTLLDQTLTEVDNQTIDDEGTYRFDFSAGVPLKSVKQLKYDLNSGTATPNVVTKYNVYGMANFFLRPTDVKTDYQVSNPSVVVGFGLTGRPWEQPIIGVGLGYHKIAGFIGAGWNRVSDPATTGGTTILQKHWDPHPKLVFGVNITAKQLADYLKPKK